MEYEYRIYEFEPKKNVRLHRYNIGIHTGHGIKTWARLTGFYDPELTPPLVGLDDIELKGYYPSFSITCEKLNLKINVNLKTLIIINAEVLLTERNKGLGCIAHKNQILIATALGFKKIEVRAYGSLDGMFNGNITWAKFGYTMAARSYKNFLKIMKEKKAYPKKYNFIQKILYERDRLMIKTKNEDFCNKNFPSWFGEFDLSPTSINKRIFEVYLHRKKFHP